MSPSPAIGRLSAALLDPRGPRISRDASRRFVLSRDAGCFTGLAISRGPTGDNPTWQRAGSALEAGAPEREDIANLSFGPDLRFAIATRFLPPLNGWASSLGNLFKPHDAISKAITRLELRKGGTGQQGVRLDEPTPDRAPARRDVRPRGPDRRFASKYACATRAFLGTRGTRHRTTMAPGHVATGSWRSDSVRSPRQLLAGRSRQLNPTNATTIPARPIPPSRPALNARLLPWTAAATGS